MKPTHTQSHTTSVQTTINNAWRQLPRTLPKGGLLYITSAKSPKDLCRPHTTGNISRPECSCSLIPAENPQRSSTSTTERQRGHAGMSGIAISRQKKFRPHGKTCHRLVIDSVTEQQIVELRLLSNNRRADYSATSYTFKTLQPTKDSAFTSRASAVHIWHFAETILHSSLFYGGILSLDGENQQLVCARAKLLWWDQSAAVRHIFLFFFYSVLQRQSRLCVY